ncbi:hypothetical protein QOZ80_3AG0234620 [Eleusine coracana subsp. coracana]|nr:hypothetical protein QOZ80_3AG0234620 [Eleusine coracana subsp. coracana]
MGTYLRNHSDDEFSVAGEKPDVEFMDYQNDDTLQSYDLEDGPVVVTAPFPFKNGQPKSVLVGETSADTISIENTSPEPVNLWSVRIFSSNPEDSYVLSMMEPPRNDSDEEAKQAFLEFFSTLLVMEEINLEEEMRSYDMEGVSMKRRGRNLSLEVPGLAEKRPSLVQGDYIFARHAGSDARTFQGFIHKVEADEIFLQFDEIFHCNHRDRNLYDVSFTYNRVSMRRRYKAIHEVEIMGPDILFPCQSPCRSLKKWSFKPLNPHINTEQADAVAMILGCRGVPPYVIYGPPGTGKTMTIVEAILQLYTGKRRTNILVCAASNSAADHVLEKLLEASYLIRSNDIFRLNAPSRQYDDVNPDFIRFCFFEDMVFKCPPLQALTRYRIIISTYMSSSLLQSEGIHHGHFTHIFLDEAGQASEPEAMIPLSGLRGRDTVVVLAGDPNQLGPVVHCRQAEKDGLGKSYLERLLYEFEPYETRNPNYVTKLVKNYRCHPAILHLPSELFYEGELIACKEDKVSSEYDCIGLPNKSFPVLFFGIQGCDEREGNNPSWFNRIEVSKVVSIIRSLTRAGDVREADIGVITPYRQQVTKIKKALEAFEMPDLKVGSVEQFQGQEREVIIISTVRSTVKHNEFDKFFNLGFLSNQKRFNVAITRAKSLLIIVGNPHIVTKDRHWDRLLRYCSDNSSYQGCPLPPPESYSQESISSGYSERQSESAGWECNQQEVANHNYNQEPSDFGSTHYNATPVASDNPVEWSEEKPDDEYQPFSNADAGPEEEMPKQHVEQEAEQGDEQSNQYSTNDDQLQDAYATKYNFPPGWCDVSSIPATGWE